jgi:acyl-CoA reductase-like NAD-dependent aldehyde dehydrogenase
MFQDNCDKCGVLTENPFHTSEGDNHHVHLCGRCWSKPSWAIYHNPPTGKMIAPVPFQTKEDAERALELAERFGLRWAYVDKA